MSSRKAPSTTLQIACFIPKVSPSNCLSHTHSNFD
jgi:hypothetical protein